MGGLVIIYLFIIIQKQLVRCLLLFILVYPFLGAVSTFCVCGVVCVCGVYLINSTNEFSCLSQCVMGQNGPTGTQNGI